MAIEEAQLIKATLHEPASGHAQRASPDHARRRPRAQAMSAAAHPGGDPAARSRPTARELASSVENLRGEVVKATDWRRQLRAHKREVIIGAAVAGFVVGGGIAAMTGLLTGRRSSRGTRRHAGVGLGGGWDAAGRPRRRVSSAIVLRRAGSPTTRAAAICIEAATGIATSAPRTPEQRRAEQHGDEHHERVHVDRALLDLRLDQRVLDLLVDDRADRPDDRGRREVARTRVTTPTMIAPIVAPTSGTRSAKKMMIASGAANGTPRMISTM